MMDQALMLARRGEGAVEPNPMVGAVIARGGRVLGAGWHRRFGGRHAEVEAIADCRRRGHDPAGATMFVSLEPCSHQGKTPPCVGAVIEAGLSEVVVAMVDPFAGVGGRGIERLRAAGVAVRVGPGEAAARRLNEPYLKRVATGLPWVIVKWAQTLDGAIATAAGDSRWISSEASRRRVHELRGRVDAIVTGIGTVLADDPQLTARGVAVRRVARRFVVGDPAAIPAGAKLLTDGGPPVDFVADVPALADLLRRMAADEGATNVLVEAGGGLVGKLLAAGLVDQLLVFVAPRVLGDAAAQGPVRGFERGAIAEATGLSLVGSERIGDDLLLDYRVQVTEPGQG